MDNLVDKNVAIILARGGSKRIKNKNIINFINKPLLSWTIEAALKAGIFENVIVSTDSKRIKKIALDSGAEVPFMRNMYNDDFSLSSEATLFTLKKLEKNLNKEFDNVFQLMANCPFRDSKTIKSAFSFFKKKNAKSLITCTEFGWLNPWWSILLDKNNHGKNLFPKKIKMRSQDLETIYGISGAIWISDVYTLKKYKTFYSPKHVYFPIDWKSAFDIDTPKDLDLAKKLF